MRNILKGYHERTAIEVSLSPSTGGTVVYDNLPGESLTLDSLPIGTEIVLDNGDYLIYYNGLPRGEMVVTPSSGYKLESIFVKRGGVDTEVTSTPIVLEDGDEIGAAFCLPDYLCFTANTAGSTVQLIKSGSPAAVALETSTDGKNWTTYTVGDTITLTNIGDKVYWRTSSETDTTFTTNAGSYYNFVMTGSIAGSGDVNYLLNKNSTTTLSDYCYYELFNGCTSLTTAPELPATTLTKQCYYSMFNGCTSLTTAPALPATTLADSCYKSMFKGCTSLTTAPITLPATTLTKSCYYYMFYGCTSLTTAPSLPATTLTNYCCFGMFYGCTSLTTVPSLPATTLSDYCYMYMFYQCSKIKLSTTKTGEYQTAYRIPTTGTGTSGTKSLTYMFSYTGGTFTGEPSINTTYYTSNTVVPAT